MFHLNSAPVNAGELHRFVGSIANELDRSKPDPDRVAFIVAVDDGHEVLMLTSEHEGPAATAQIDQLLATPRRKLAMVSSTGWSPADSVPIGLAWIIIAVGVGGAPACVAARHVADRGPWALIAPTESPWFILSTASALRAAVEDGEPLRMKIANGTELYRRPDECPDPPLDERGEL